MNFPEPEDVSELASIYTPSSTPSILLQTLSSHFFSAFVNEPVTPILSIMPLDGSIKFLKIKYTC